MRAYLAPIKIRFMVFLLWLAGVCLMAGMVTLVSGAGYGAAITISQWITGQ